MRTALNPFSSRPNQLIRILSFSKTTMPMLPDWAHTDVHAGTVLSSRHPTSITKQIRETRFGIGVLFLAHFLRAIQGGSKRFVFRPWEVALSRYHLAYSFPYLPNSPASFFLSLWISNCLLARIPTPASRKFHPPPLKQQQPPISNCMMQIQL